MFLWGGGGANFCHRNNHALIRNVWVRFFFGGGRVFCIETTQFDLQSKSLVCFFLMGGDKFKTGCS